MSASHGTQDYSTLEVAPRPYTDYPEVSHTDYPEVTHSDLPEASPSHLPEVGSHAGVAAGSKENYPEVVEGSGYAAIKPYPYDTATTPVSPPEPKICGLKRKHFWIALAIATVLIIAIIVGVVVGVVVTRSGSGDGSSSGSDSNSNGNSTANATTDGKALYSNTQLASANFTDEYGYDNYLLVYQLNDLSIYMSAYNSSGAKWTVSPVVNGSDNEVKQGTALALDVNRVDEDSRDIHLYWQMPSSAASTTISGLNYTAEMHISTSSQVVESNWESMASVNNFNSMSGSRLASYGKQCDYCNQYTYFWWQTSEGFYGSENAGSGWQGGSPIGEQIAPATNTSLAQAHSGATTADGAIDRRSMNIFYRSTGGGLTQLRMGNDMVITHDLGRSIGSDTKIAAFSTGYNETTDNFPTPLGFQILTLDPDNDNGVQSTYFKGSDWTVSRDEVTDLADCKGRATMTANPGRRLYCLVDGDSGTNIVEFAWGGNPDDASSYSSWSKVGTVTISE
ncbi:hypothetical protein F5Y15DRAFT_414107 [Xylariaceae sp. FL0016]|nr:hypothetical protein F5Y15DRAFT_414107 [Xylariaceae sp. FL0016]